MATTLTSYGPTRITLSGTIGVATAVTLPSGAACIELATETANAEVYWSHTGTDAVAIGNNYGLVPNSALGGPAYRINIDRGLFGLPAVIYLAGSVATTVVQAVVYPSRQ